MFMKTPRLPSHKRKTQQLLSVDNLFVLPQIPVNENLGFIPACTDGHKTQGKYVRKFYEP